MNSSHADQIDAAAPPVSMMTLIRAAHLLEERMESALAGVGLSSPKLTVLTELVSAGRPLSLSELATRVSCVRSNMTQLVDRLEADGLVARVDDPADRRSVRAALTEEGRTRQAAGANAVARLEAEFASAVAGDDRAALARLLQRLR